jgi:hypothetical protein
LCHPENIEGSICLLSQFYIIKIEISKNPVPKGAMNLLVGGIYRLLTQEDRGQEFAKGEKMYFERFRGA